MNIRLLPIVACASCAIAAGQSDKRAEAEYYAAAYARHFVVPVAFVRAIIAQESGWQVCPVSRKGAAGLMQLMPETARELGVRDGCDLNQNISAGVRHLARLMAIFHGDLRLVAAAYNAGEAVILARGLSYANPAVIAYVNGIRKATESPLIPRVQGEDHDRPLSRSAIDGDIDSRRPDGSREDSAPSDHAVP